MERIPYGKYSKEFRQEAVKLVIEGGLSIPEAGRRLSLAPSTLGSWVRAYKKGKLSEVGKNHKPQTEVEMENYRLKRELAEVKMERDIKALYASSGNASGRAHLPLRTEITAYV